MSKLKGLLLTEGMHGMISQVEGLAKVHFLEKMGAESCAKMVFDKFNEVLSKTDAGRCKVVKVECFENDKNSSIYYE